MKILIKKSKLRTEWMGLTEEQPQEKCTGILENQPKKKIVTINPEEKKAQEIQAEGLRDTGDRMSKISVIRILGDERISQKQQLQTFQK